MSASSSVSHVTVASAPIDAETCRGRIFLLGPGDLAAFDVYTGRPLWNKKKLTKDMTPGRRGSSGMSGNHIVAAEDALYVVYPDVCQRVSPVLKSTQAKPLFALPNTLPFATT